MDIRLKPIGVNTNLPKITLAFLTLINFEKSLTKVRPLILQSKDLCISRWHPATYSFIDWDLKHFKMPLIENTPQV